MWTLPQCRFWQDNHTHDSTFSYGNFFRTFSMVFNCHSLFNEVAYLAALCRLRSRFAICDANLKPLKTKIYEKTCLLLWILAVSVIGRFGPHLTIVMKFVTQNNFKNGPGISDCLLGFYPTQNLSPSLVLNSSIVLVVSNLYMNWSGVCCNPGILPLVPVPTALSNRNFPSPPLSCSADPYKVTQLQTGEGSQYGSRRRPIRTECSAPQFFALHSQVASELRNWDSTTARSKTKWAKIKQLKLEQKTDKQQNIRK